jgi:glycosyltransferase involved in cell wall biosynthesis
MTVAATERKEGGTRTHGEARAQRPLVTIVTVVFRAKEELLKLLKNLSEMDHSDFELIVVDGGSSDGTVEALREWDDKVDYWVSEKDDGIYHAMNKAQALAHGHFLLHLNAGDRLLQIPRKELELARKENYDIVSFRVSVDNSRYFVPRSGFMLRLKNTLHHQGTFYRREAILPYDLNYKILADFDLNQRMAKRGARIKLSDTVVSLHESGGAADSINGYDEHKRIVGSNHGVVYVAVSLTISELKGIRMRRTAALRRWLSGTQKSA